MPSFSEFLERTGGKPGVQMLPGQEEEGLPFIGKPASVPSSPFGGIA